MERIDKIIKGIKLKDIELKELDNDDKEKEKKEIDNDNDNKLVLKDNLNYKINYIINKMKMKITNSMDMKLDKEREELLKELGYYIKCKAITIEEVKEYLNDIEIIYLQEIYKHCSFSNMSLNEVLSKLIPEEMNRQEIDIREKENKDSIIGKLTIPSFIGIIGLNGHGKTLLSLEILEDLRLQGEKTLYIQMEDFKTKMNSIYKGDIYYLLTGSIEEIEGIINKRLATAIVIDSLAMIKRNNLEEEREILRRLYILSLRKVVIVINHLSKESKRNKNKLENLSLSDSIGSSYFENLLDFGVILFKENERYFRYKIAKNRFGKLYEGTLELINIDGILSFK